MPQTSGETLLSGQSLQASAPERGPAPRYDRVGAVALVTFSRPPNNHFSVELIASLADVFERADADPEARATVLASEGRHFCAGADLSDGVGEAERLYEQALRLFSLRKPMVAAIQGGAVGGGLGLALVADFRIVASSSRLTANFVKLGTHPGFGLTYTLPRLVGPQKAAEILYTGRRLSGEDALKCGLADRLVDEAQLSSAAVSLAAEISENAPLALEETRATLRKDLVEQVRRQTRIEAEKQARLFKTADFAEGVRAVAERRPGQWSRR